MRVDARLSVRTRISKDARYFTCSSDCAHIFRIVISVLAVITIEFMQLTSTNAGTMGIAFDLTALQASMRLLGLGTTGGEGYIGGYSPIGYPVASGQYRCIWIPMVWNVGSAIVPQRRPRFLVSIRTAGRKPI